MKKIWWYIITLRYLKPVQIYGRIWYRLRTKGSSFKSVDPPAVNQKSLELLAKCKFWPHSHHRLVSPSTIRVFEKSVPIASPEDWQGKDLLLLEKYNLHYFDFLKGDLDQGAPSAGSANLVQHWIESVGRRDSASPACRVAWDPYPMSLRIVNWVKWLAAFGPKSLVDSEAFLTALYNQGRYLFSHWEKFLLGNHFFTNLKALLFVSVIFDDPQSRHWRKVCLKELRRQLDEQILSDGGYFERTAMYHAIILEDLIDLYQLDQHTRVLNSEVRRQIKDSIPKMLAWLQAMTHPDGDLTFFNDATHGVALSLEELKSYAQAQGVNLSPAGQGKVQHLKASGFVTARNKTYYLAADIGSVGPSYLPGHAHAETLSFELSWLGQRLLVNSGVSTYGIGEERQRQRSTAAHNTVVLNEKNSSQVWKSFRVARRARVEDVHIEKHKVSARHTGYKTLFGGSWHRRSWFLGAECLRVDDELKGAFQTARSHWHFHPEVNVQQIAPNQLRLTWLEEVVFFLSSEPIALHSGTYHPAFNVTQPCTKAIIELKTSHASVEIRGTLE